MTCTERERPLPRNGNAAEFPVPGVPPSVLRSCRTAGREYICTLMDFICFWYIYIYICLECIGQICTNRYEYRKLYITYIYMFNINNMIYTYICTIIHKYTPTKKYIHIHVNLDVIFSTVIQSYPVALEVFSLDLGCKAWTVGTMVGAPVTSKQDSFCEMPFVVVGFDNKSLSVKYWTRPTSR